MYNVEYECERCGEKWWVEYPHPSYCPTWHESGVMPRHGDVEPHYYEWEGKQKQTQRRKAYAFPTGRVTRMEGGVSVEYGSGEKYYPFRRPRPDPQYSKNQGVWYNDENKWQFAVMRNAKIIYISDGYETEKEAFCGFVITATELLGADAIEIEGLTKETFVATD